MDEINLDKELALESIACSCNEIAMKVDNVWKCCSCGRIKESTFIEEIGKEIDKEIRRIRQRMKEILEVKE